MGGGHRTETRQMKEGPYHYKRETDRQIEIKKKKKLSQACTLFFFFFLFSPSAHPAPCFDDKPRRLLLFGAIRGMCDIFNPRL
jgi:hypothetical protein